MDCGLSHEYVTVKQRTRETLPCIRIPACATLASGEAVVLAYFSFIKSFRDFRLNRAEFLVQSICIGMPSRRCQEYRVAFRYKDWEHML